MLYTRKGDRGTSGLFGTKERFPKESPVYDALGTLDELNALLGVCFALSKRKEVGAVQQHLFIIQAELAGAKKSIIEEQVTQLEHMTDTLEAMVPHQGSFVVSGSTKMSALFDYARAVSRRAEREVIKARYISTCSPATYAYLNRLSSLLFALARHESAKAGIVEQTPRYE